MDKEIHYEPPPLQCPFLHSPVLRLRPRFPAWRRSLQPPSGRLLLPDRRPQAAAPSPVAPPLVPLRWPVCFSRFRHAGLPQSLTRGLVGELTTIRLGGLLPRLLLGRPIYSGRAPASGGRGYPARTTHREELNFCCLCTPQAGWGVHIVHCRVEVRGLKMRQLDDLKDLNGIHCAYLNPAAMSPPSCSGLDRNSWFSCRRLPGSTAATLLLSLHGTTHHFLSCEASWGRGGRQWLREEDDSGNLQCKRLTMLPLILSSSSYSDARTNYKGGSGGDLGCRPTTLRQKSRRYHRSRGFPASLPSVKSNDRAG